MKLTAKLTALRKQTRGLATVERAKRCCDVALQLEKAGEYDEACEALDEFWPDRNEHPKLDNLDDATQAEILLRVGALSGWLGTAGQHAGSQEMAKDLITRSILVFEKLEQSERLAEAHSDLAVCYWREGAFDEARTHLRRAL